MGIKIRCTNPNHSDDNPSMSIYADGGFCHSCGYLDRSAVDDSEPQQPEDLEAKFVYIQELPRTEIRGLQLPYDQHGYYIVWPDHTYYKKRMWEGLSRYLGPVGHKPKLLQISGIGNSIVIVEGELNALSLSLVYKGSIASPGSAIGLCNTNYRSIYLQYTGEIAIVVDRDAAGVSAGLTLKRELQQKGKQVRLIACSRDLNLILQQDGKEGLKEWLQNENLEM